MQIVSGDITRDITGEIVYLKAYKQMVGANRLPFIMRRKEVRRMC